MRRGSRRALTDSAATLMGFVALCVLLLALADARPTVNVAAFVAGLTFVVAVVSSVVRRRPRFCGPADRITLVRAVLAAGCATIVVLSLAGSVPVRSWWLVLLAVPALLLDAVDGLVARRTATTSSAGARLDMETDAALLLVLSVPVAMAVGWWAVLIGLMRYLFVAAGRLRPGLRDPLPASRFRQVTAGVQGGVLAVALVPFIPVSAATALVAASLALLCVSFGRDVITLEHDVRPRDEHVPG